jgi:hypothetical protein
MRNRYLASNHAEHAPTPSAHAFFGWYLAYGAMGAAPA